MWEPGFHILFKFTEGPDYCAITHRPCPRMF